MSDNLSDEFKSISVTERDETLNPRQLRDAGFVPATLYGLKGKPSRNIQLREHEFRMAYREGNRAFVFDGFNNLFARTQQLQVDPVTQAILSVEFVETTEQEALERRQAREEAAKREEEERLALEEKLREEAKKRAEAEAAAAAEAEAAGLAAPATDGGGDGGGDAKPAEEKKEEAGASA